MTAAIRLPSRSGLLDVLQEAQRTGSSLNVGGRLNSLVHPAANVLRGTHLLTCGKIKRAGSSRPCLHFTAKKPPLSRQRGGAERLGSPLAPDFVVARPSTACSLSIRTARAAPMRAAQGRAILGALSDGAERLATARSLRSDGEMKKWGVTWGCLSRLARSSRSSMRPARRGPATPAARARRARLLLR